MGNVTLGYIVDSLIGIERPFVVVSSRACGIVEVSLTNRRNVLAAALTTVVLLPGLAGAQTYTAPQARRQFITLSYNWSYTCLLYTSPSPRD